MRKIGKLFRELQRFATSSTASVGVAEDAKVARVIGEESASTFELVDRFVDLAHDQVSLPENCMSDPRIGLPLREPLQELDRPIISASEVVAPSHIHFDYLRERIDFMGALHLRSGFCKATH